MPVALDVDADLGILRLDLAGRWSFRSFCDMWLSIDRLYFGLIALNPRYEIWHQPNIDTKIPKGLKQQSIRARRNQREIWGKVPMIFKDRPKVLYGSNRPIVRDLGFRQSEWETQNLPDPMIDRQMRRIFRGQHFRVKGLEVSELSLASPGHASGEGFLEPISLAHALLDDFIGDGIDHRSTMRKIAITQHRLDLLEKIYEWEIEHLREFPRDLIEDIKVREYLRKQVARAATSGGGQIERISHFDSSA